MDFFTGKKISNLMIFSLIIINIILLASFWYKNTDNNKLTPNENNFNKDLDRPNIKPYIRARPGLRSLLKEKFNFSSDQINKFQNLRDDHFENAGKIRSEIDALRKKMMELLLEKKIDNQIAEKISLQIGTKIAMHENLVFSHFEDLIKIPQDNQLNEYKYFILGMLDRRKKPRNNSREIRGPSPERRDRAQRDNYQRPPQRRRDHPQSNNQNFNMENRINHLSNRLNLSENQILQLRKIFEEGSKINHNRPSEKPYEKMLKLNREIENILTTEQKALFKKLRSDRRQNRRN